MFAFIDPYNLGVRWSTLESLARFKSRSKNKVELWILCFSSAIPRVLGGLGITGSNQSNDDLKRLVGATMARWGRIDALINSAGHGPRAPLLEITDEDWHKGMDVYFLNVVRPVRLVTPVMLAQKSGAIVNISTFAAFEPDPVFPTSGVFRAGLAA